MVVSLVVEVRIEGFQVLGVVHGFASAARREPLKAKGQNRPSTLQQQGPQLLSGFSFMRFTEAEPDYGGVVRAGLCFD